ncbi:hypothetical protein [Pantoea coffeiphila]|uniref:Uncharacterized protein n=1 Tax=Pantoea coffeiphila TaxID=1465635 RepID=A0A2S9IHW3_9GAMM|nr:hypothetical protein [Pantoea coffeiphila]PRD17373.1 hypothetical protein CQW29_01695 [Pantoea coffeiphila]
MNSQINQPQPAWLRAGSNAAGQLPDDRRRAALAAFLAESESLAPLLMLHSLMRLEFCAEDRWQIADRRQQLRIAPCFDELLQRWHLHLLDEGLLDSHDDDIWTLSPCAPAEHQLEQRIDDARHRLRQLMNWLDDATPLADALFSRSQQMEDWLRAPSLAKDWRPDLNLHQLLHMPGIISDYFAGIAVSVLPLLLDESRSDVPSLLALGYTPPRLQDCLTRVAASVVPLDSERSLADQLPGDSLHDAVVLSDLLNQPSPDHLLAELRPWLAPGAVLMLLQNTAERPLHWVTPAAVQAHARVGQLEAHCEHRCQQMLSQAGFALLQSWPQADSPMAFAGQRLFVARYDPSSYR